jgi:hypothetical protein
VALGQAGLAVNSTWSRTERTDIRDRVHEIAQKAEGAKINDFDTCLNIRVIIIKAQRPTLVRF